MNEQEGLDRLAREWMDRAEEDRRVVEVLPKDGGFAGTICFHAHQCIEKSLKAYLTAHGVRIRRTHDLAVLGERCAAIEPRFEPHLGPISGLSEYAVEPRYPGGSYPTDEDAEEAAHIAEDVYMLVQTLLRDRRRDRDDVPDGRKE